MNVQIKVNNAKEAVSSHEVQSGAGARGQPLRLQAQRNVKYQLIDEDTGFAPENIATQRVGNDLHIAFEGGDVDQPDVVVAGYYDNPGAAALVGQGENGVYYNYVPESGVADDALSQLGVSKLAGQALGGDEFATPFWIPADVNPMAALGLLPLAGLAGGGGGSDGGDSSSVSSNSGAGGSGSGGGRGDAGGDKGGGGQGDQDPSTPPSNPDPDTTAPTLRVTIHEDGTVTFQFSEPVKGFVVGDVRVSHGSIDNLVQDAHDSSLWTAELTPPANYEGEVEVSVADGSYTDLAGNPGTGGSDTAFVDTLAPSAPTVEITDDKNNDGWLNADELDGSATVAVAITLPDDARVGDTLTVTVNGTEQEPVTITGTMLTGGYTLDVPQPGHDGQLVVSATVTDAAGNVSAPGSDSAMVDTEAPAAPEVTIGDGDDGVISPCDLTEDGQVEVTVRPGEPVQAGDTLVIVVDGGESFEVPVTEANVDDINENGYTTTVDVPAEGEDLLVSATVTDAAGNESAPGSDCSVVALEGPSAPIVEITDDVNNDGWLNADELGDSATVAVQITLRADAQEGDTLTVTVNGAEQTPVQITEEMLTDGYTMTVDVPAEGEELVVSATVTDAGEKVSPPGSDSAVVDTEAPGAPGVIIADGDDGFINPGDVSEDGQVGVTICPCHPVQVGDTIVISVAGGATFEVPVTADNVDGITANGYTTMVDVPGEGETLQVSATVTDAAGNESAPGTDSSMVDLLMPSVQVTIHDDGTVSFQFSEAVKGFGRHDVQVNRGHIRNLQQDSDDPSLWTAELTPDADYEGNVTVSVADDSYTDLAGNPGTGGSDTAFVDTLAPSVEVTIHRDGTVSFQFSEAVKGFETDDVQVSHGHIRGLTKVNGDSSLWTARLTDWDWEDYEGSVTVSLADGSYTDLADNPGTGGSDTAFVDALKPSVDVTIHQDGTVSFLFSEEITGFEVADIKVNNGSIDNLQQDPDYPLLWTAELTPLPNCDVVVTVPYGSYADLAGNPGTVGIDSAWSDDDSEQFSGVDDVILYGGAGDDDLTGGAGHDVLVGRAGDDLLWGGDGDDLLVGGAGNDTLDGGAGNDVLVGGTGDDVLTGGSGADQFVFDGTADNGSDEISDFSAAEGDTLVFTGIDDLADLDAVWNQDTEIMSFDNGSTLHLPGVSISGSATDWLQDNATTHIII